MSPRLPKFLSLCAIGLFAALTIHAQKSTSISLGDAANHALAQSQLTAPGSSAFHLKATILETTNPDSDYKADIEEYWVSPEKWRRTIQSPHFSQTLIVNGDKTSEQDTGDYYPFWLHDLVTAIFDPLPMLDQLTHTTAKIPVPQDSTGSTACARFQNQMGPPNAQIGVFSVFCFESSHGLLDSVVTPGYDALFKGYKRFRGKSVARRIVTDPEPGTTIQATITELSELSNQDDNLFDIQQSTAQKHRLRSFASTNPFCLETR